MTRDSEILGTLFLLTRASLCFFVFIISSSKKSHLLFNTDDSPRFISRRAATIRQCVAGHALGHNKRIVHKPNKPPESLNTNPFSQHYSQY